MDSRYTPPPKYKYTDAPARLRAWREWERFFGEVMACEGHEAVMIDPGQVNVHATRESIRRHAKRARVRIRVNVVDGRIYATPKQRRKTVMPEFSYKSIVMQPRPARSESEDCGVSERAG
jgi:hypothetical protein